VRLSRTQILFIGIILLAFAGAGVNFAAQSRHAGDSPSLRLVLNVPANRIYVYENGERTRSFRVSVGQRRFATPAGSYTIRQAIWNPWWHPPKSAWARDEKPARPGYDNPMGRVKLNFTELYYVHGTPAENEDALGLPASHGCVRMANHDVIELTRIIHRHATPQLSAAAVQALVDNPSDTRTIRFRNAVPFAVVYDVAVVRDNFLILYPDVYARLGSRAAVIDQVEEVLREHGVDLERVNRRELERLVDKSMKMRVAMSLDELTSRVRVADDPDARY
jgi:murein L,D-transpeptidase YcbB/YkuD